MHIIEYDLGITVSSQSMVFSLFTLCVRYLTDNGIKIDVDDDILERAKRIKTITDSIIIDGFEYIPAMMVENDQCLVISYKPKHIMAFFNRSISQHFIVYYTNVDIGRSFIWVLHNDHLIVKNYSKQCIVIHVKDGYYFASKSQNSIKQSASDVHQFFWKQNRDQYIPKYTKTITNEYKEIYDKNVDLFDINSLITFWKANKDIMMNNAIFGYITTYLNYVEKNIKKIKEIKEMIHLGYNDEMDLLCFAHLIFEFCNKNDDDIYFQLFYRRGKKYTANDIF